MAIGIAVTGSSRRRLHLRRRPGHCRPRRLSGQLRRLPRPDLGGSNEAPQLAGGSFMAQWGERSAGDLVLHHGRDAADQPGRAWTAAITNIVAYILQANGAAAGAQALTPQATSTIRSVAMQQAPPAAPAAAPAQAAGGVREEREVAATARCAGGSTDAGLTLKGEITNYVPVTDEMLRNPPPGDWLMARRNYQAWSYSPLDEITRDNVEGPEARVGLGDERRRREPADAARAQRHHVSRATRATSCRRSTRRTGELIWENQVGPNAQSGSAPMRNIAIYQDKVFIATTDARLVALDARTGKMVWDTRDRRSREGVHEHRAGRSSRAAR